MIIKYYEDVKEEERSEGVKKRVVIGKPDGAHNFIMRVFEVEPGFSSSFHEHSWEHEIFVIKGEAHIRNGREEKIPIREGNVIFIPPFEKHCMENHSNEVFRFICLIPSDAE